MWIRSAVEDQPEHRQPPHFPTDRSLWAGIVLAPASWSLQLQVTYMLVPWVCNNGRHWVLFASSAFFLLLTLAAGIMCWRDWQHRGRGWPRGTEGGRDERRLFLSVLGIMTGSLFALLIIAQATAALFIHPCYH